jgi:hypothetical protein
MQFGKIFLVSKVHLLESRNPSKTQILAIAKVVAIPTKR